MVKRGRLIRCPFPIILFNSRLTNELYVVYLYTMTKETVRGRLLHNAITCYRCGPGQINEKDHRCANICGPGTKPLLRAVAIG